MATADVSLATRELFVRTLQTEVVMKTPFIEELQRRRQVKYKGGKYIEKLVDTDDDQSDMMQGYTANTALTDEKRTSLGKPRFLWRLDQFPLRYDVDEYLQNVTAGKEEQLLDLVEHMVKKARRSTKLWLQKSIFNYGGTSPVADGNLHRVQSLISALNHDSTYGTVARSFGTSNPWWQGADPAALCENISASGSNQDTSYPLTITNLRKWINETDISHYMEGEDDLMVLMCPTLWDKLAAEMESRLVYKPGLKQKQGIRSMIFDGHEIVSVPYLQKTATTRTWLFILNLRYFELRIHTARNFKMTDFKWQGEVSKGHDYWLARIMIAGNFMCWKPNSSLWLSAVS